MNFCSKLFIFSSNSCQALSESLAKL
uniref:Uncharacterized protein n=1 Tax=Arundo donax TaxID=35708 RepID=A0A0A8YTG2_ARUDO